MANAAPVRLAALLVEHALLLLLILEVHLVPVHHRAVLVAPLLHMVGKLRMLLRNLDLLLQPLLLIGQLAQPVFEHLRLDLLLLHV